MRMDFKAPAEVALSERVQREPTASRMLKVYALAGVDAPGKLFDVLADEDEGYGADRNAAVFVLRRWLARSPKNADALFDGKSKGLLIDKRLRLKEAATIVELLHDFSEDAAHRPATFELLAGYLRNDRIAIRELAWWQLQHLTPGFKGPFYNPAMPPDMRGVAADAWQRLVDDKKLPPSAPTAPAPPDKPGGP
jgi:hypothetical protein